MIAVFLHLVKLFARPKLRRAFLWAVLALAAIAAAFAFVARERADAAGDALLERDAQQSKGIKDAITRSAPSPRPSGGEFVECLRRGGPGCL